VMEAIRGSIGMIFGVFLLWSILQIMSDPLG
jgi:hypothetical protein